MSREFKTGVVAVITILLFVWGFNFMKGQNIFKANTRVFYVEYPNIQGLNRSSIVTINGHEVGKVSGVAFNKSDGKRGGLIVEFTLNTDFDFSKKSVARIYSASLLGGQSLAIIPNYEGELAVSGDYLKGEVESDIFSSVGEKLNPLQAKLENVIVSADSVFSGINQIFSDKSINSINNTIANIEFTVADIRQTIASVNELVDSTKVDMKITLQNTKNITEDLAVFSKNLTKVDFNKIVKDSEIALANINSLLTKIDNGEGTLGQLINDKVMYTNLTNASKELEELLRDLKLNPKRYVQFSVFGKKQKEYEPEEETPIKD